MVDEVSIRFLRLMRDYVMYVHLCVGGCTNANNGQPVPQNNLQTFAGKKIIAQKHSECGQMIWSGICGAIAIK